MAHVILIGHGFSLYYYAASNSNKDTKFYIENGKLLDAKCIPSIVCSIECNNNAALLKETPDNEFLLSSDFGVLDKKHLPKEMISVNFKEYKKIIGGHDFYIYILKSNDVVVIPAEYNKGFTLTWLKQNISQYLKTNDLEYHWLACMSIIDTTNKNEICNQCTSDLTEVNEIIDIGNLTLK